MKKLLIVICVLLLAGCARSDIKQGYENMQIDNGKIKSYSLDLRIYGTLNKKNINEIVRIKNYKNTNYEISINTSTKDNNVTKSFVETVDLTNLDDWDPEKQTNKVYVKNGKIYTADESGTYTLNNKKVKYSNPAVYLKGLSDIKTTSSGIKEKIGDNTYTKYNLTINNSAVEEIISDTGLTDLKAKSDVNATVYLDKNHFVYKVAYYIDTITINVNYFAINKTTDIDFPSEIQ